MNTLRFRKIIGAASVAAALVLTLAACEGATATTPTPAGQTGTSVTSSGDSGSKPSTGIPGSGTVGAFPASAPGFASMDMARIGQQIVPPGTSGQQYGIWVSGMGSVKATPDVLLLQFGVEARGDTVAAARERAAAAMTAALKALKDNKVADADIQTTGFSIYPIFNYNTTRDGNSVPQIVGYQVTNSATAKLRDLDTSGTVIDAVAAAGGNEVRIHNIAFIIDDPKPLEAKARELALQDAMAKARQVAQVTGVNLGTPTFISESGGSPIVYQKEYARTAAGAPAADVSTPIQTGQSEVTMAVQVVFAIQ